MHTSFPRFVALTALAASLSACGAQSRLLLALIPSPAGSTSSLVVSEPGLNTRLLFGEVAVAHPFEGATAQAFVLGAQAPFAEGKIDQDGRFTLGVPDYVPSGSVLFVVATQGGKTASALTKPPEFRSIQAVKPQVRLTLASSISIASLKKRFIAASQSISTLKGSSGVSYQASLLEVYEVLLRRAESALPAQPAAALTTLVLTGLEPSAASGEGNLALLPDSLHDSVRAAAEALSSLVVTAVSQGGHLPDADLLGAAGLGNDKAPPITFSAGGSGGGSSGGPPSDAGAAGAGSVAIRDGEVVDTDASVVIRLNP